MTPEQYEFIIGLLVEELWRKHQEIGQLNANANTREVLAQVSKDKKGNNYALIKVQKQKQIPPPQLPKRARDGKFLRSKK